MKLITALVSASLFFSNNSSNPDIFHPPSKPAHLYVSHFENVLGTSMELKISAFSQQDAQVAESAAKLEISRLEKILSGYNANSEFSRWFATFQQPVHVSPELYEVLDLFDQWRIRTGGALDASAEVITRLWKQAAAQQRVPNPQELEKAVAEVKQTHWKLDAVARTATHLSKSPLMLNTFVKSYIIKHAVNAAMASAKLNAIVMNIGGDMVIAGKLNETVLVSDPTADAENDSPLDQLQVSNRAVATSGNYRRGELINGQWYSHIVDPRTGQPADDIISATIVAPNAVDAGALATAFNVMSISESEKLAATVPGAAYLIITKKGERIESPGWKDIETPAFKQIKLPGNSVNKNKPGRGWNNDFELIINLEINLQKEGFVKRPYVAVWIEDEDHAAVRTVSVWHGKDKYMPELKSWYLKYRGMYSTDQNFAASVTSATRSAGKYTVKWDGKDDKGNYVKPGTYTVKIEASREHGTYQLMRQEIKCDDKPKQLNLIGNIEIASASLDYRKKTSSN